MRAAQKPIIWGIKLWPMTLMGKFFILTNSHFWIFRFSLRISPTLSESYGPKLDSQSDYDCSADFPLHKLVSYSPDWPDSWKILVAPARGMVFCPYPLSPNFSDSLRNCQAKATPPIFYSRPAQPQLFFYGQVMTIPNRILKRARARFFLLLAPEKSCSWFSLRFGETRREKDVMIKLLN